MRALLAEDNGIVRAALRIVLERRGFDVVAVENVSELRDDAALPACDLAVLSADAAMFEFSNLCVRLRAANPRVYIAAMLDAERVQEASSILEAGADDFLVSTPVIQKLDARLRVICTRLKVDPPKSTAGDDDAFFARAGVRDVGERSIFDYVPVPDVLEETYRRLGYSTFKNIPFADAGGPTALSGWIPVVVQHGYAARWINLRFDFDRRSAEGLYAAAMNRAAPGSADIEALMRQFLGFVREGLDTQTASEGYVLHFPVVPRVFRPSPDHAGPISSRARVEQVGYQVSADIALRLTASMERTRTVERAITQLRPLDVLATPIESEGERTLLREGIMLDEAYIDRIERLAYLSDVSSRIHVFRPPVDTALFLERA